VVYEGNERHDFVERDGRFAAKQGAAVPADASLALLKLYTQTFHGDGIRTTGTADKEALEKLKALGYVK
jgi:hypothetical protein